MDILIRKAIINDYEKVIDLYAKFSRHADRQHNSFHKVLIDTNSVLYLAILNNEIAGFISYSINFVIRYDKSLMFINELFVDDAFRKQGIATKLMEKVVQDAKDKNCEYISLTSRKDRVESHGLYKKLGFDNNIAEYFRLKL